MKPISTLMKPLRSVDLATMAEAAATIERSDVCAVPAAAVVGEAMVGWVLADAFLEKFGGDSLDQIQTAVRAERSRLTARLRSNSPEPA
jgi:chorismate synthase